VPSRTDRARSRPDDDLPSTVRRSDAHAQAIYRETYRSALATYGPGERARRTAIASLKHSYEKVGDHWEAKATRGPSDDRAAASARDDTPSAGGVDALAPKVHLLELAARLGIRGRSRMTKPELVEALGRANRRATDRSRRRERATTSP
jgi:cation transport regulator ChaB